MALRENVVGVFMNSNVLPRSRSVELFIPSVPSKGMFCLDMCIL